MFFIYVVLPTRWVQKIIRMHCFYFCCPKKLAEKDLGKKIWMAYTILTSKSISILKFALKQYVLVKVSSRALQWNPGIWIKWKKMW